MSVRFPMLAAVVAVALAGCASPPTPSSGCPALAMHGVVADASGGRLRVVLDDGSSAILHPGEVRRAGPGCPTTTFAAVTVGAQVRFFTGGWAHSNPPQAWPRFVVVG